MATPASGAPTPPLPPLPADLTPFNYTKLVTEIIPLKDVIDKVELDYYNDPGTKKKAEELATVSSDIRIQLQIRPIDIDVNIIQPMKAVYEEYRRKIGFIKRIQSLANEFASPRPRPLVPNDIDNVIAKLDDASGTGPQYDATADDDRVIDGGIADGRRTMLNVYRLYIYGYFFLYEIHRLYIHFGVYIKNIYLRLVNDVLGYIRASGFRLEGFETDLDELERQLEAGRREAAELQQEIDRLRGERPTTAQDIAALNQAIEAKRAELDRINRALAAATGSSSGYRVRTEQLQEYLRTLSGITFASLNDTVNENIIRSLQNPELRGGAPASDELTTFIRDAGTRIQASVKTALVDPAQRFFDECVAVFTARIADYNEFKGRIQRFYDRLKAALGALRDLAGLDIEGKRAERETLQEAVRRTAERARLEQEQVRLDEQIEKARRSTHSISGTQAALEAKTRDLKKRFERLEAELASTSLTTSIENAKMTAELVGI